MPSKPIPKTCYEDIKHAFLTGGEQYFNECRRRVPQFVKQNFWFPGCWRTNVLGIGWDMLRTPLNLFWAPIYVVVCLLVWLADLLKWRNINNILRRVPAGFTTRVQKELCSRICKDLLQQHSHSRTDGLTQSVAQAFKAQIHGNLNDPLQDKILAQKFEVLVDETLAQYKVTRTASSDITNVVGSTLLGALAFKKFTPGGIGLGFLLAAYVAKAQAINSFFLGDALGRVYYNMFAPSPELALRMGSIAAVLVVLAFVSSISGVISDPIQYCLRLHRKRLYKMIDALERDFNAQTRARFRPKDQYVARIFDFFDAVKSYGHL